MLKTAASVLGFQHLPRDLANVNAWKTMFDSYRVIMKYGKCPKFSYTNISDKMTYANSVDFDQTAVWSGSTLFAISLSILRNSCTNSNI